MTLRWAPYPGADWSLDTTLWGYAPKWQGTAPRASIKQVNSIAQAIPRNDPNYHWPSRGYLYSGAGVGGIFDPVAWGYPSYDPYSSFDGYLRLLPGMALWDDSSGVTARYGHMPRSPDWHVREVVQNAFSWITGISLSTAQ